MDEVGFPSEKEYEYSFLTKAEQMELLARRVKELEIEHFDHRLWYQLTNDGKYILGMSQLEAQIELLTKYGQTIASEA